MKSFLVVIPARLDSSRLPRKALADIHGQPMIRRTWEQARQSRAERVYVATDHPAIQEALSDLDRTVLMTRDTHQSGTDRLAEVVEQLQLDDETIVVNVQGDEPLIPPVLIDQVADNLARHPKAGMATLCKPIHDADTFFNPNVVKVVSRADGMACWFSRAPLPWSRESFTPLNQEGRGVRVQGEHPGPFGFQHIGIYAYRAGLLRRFTAWTPCGLEETEALEQLRALWHGIDIHVAVAETVPPGGVDTAEDLERVRQAWKG